MNDSPVTAYIGLGSNLGDRKELIDRAIKSLADTDGISVSAISKIIATEPLGAPDQPGFLNAVARITTDLSAFELLEKTQHIEDQLERTRSTKWAPRTIDLDILLFGDQIIDTPELTIPHRQMHLRSFVLDGMCQLDESLTHPLINRTMRQLADRLGRGDFFVDHDSANLISIAGLIGVGKTTFAQHLSKALNTDLILEDYSNNPYLADVYAGKDSLALDSELFFLNSSAEQLAEEKFQPTQTIVNDFLFDKALIYADHWLTRDQLKKYKKQYQKISLTVQSPAVVVYLKDSIGNCLDRIAKRNRPFEQDIDIKFLAKQQTGYEKLFAARHPWPLITIPASQMDWSDYKAVEEFANELKFYISTGH